MIRKSDLYVHEKGNYVLGGETAGRVSGNPRYFSLTEAVGGDTVVVLPT